METRVADASGTEGTVRILGPWESEGQVFRIGPDTLLFQGRGEGILRADLGPRRLYFVLGKRLGALLHRPY